jgi:hypothetical protein
LAINRIGVVWRDSTTAEVRFQPTLTRKQAHKLVDAAEEWDIRTRQPGRHGGVIGTIGIRVLRALVKFLNYTTGRLDPCYATIARKTGVCERSVATALATSLRKIGVCGIVISRS